MFHIIFPFCLCVAVCFIFLTLFLIVRAKKGGCALAVIFKTIASISFVSGGVYALYLNGDILANLFIVIGLILALIGDIVLDLKVAYKKEEKLYLNAGMSSFTLSSVSYIVAIILLWNTLSKFMFFGLGSLLISVIFAIIVFLLAKPLKLEFKGFKPQVFIYSCVVAMVAIFSLGISFFVPGFALFAVGGILILLSDLVLSTMYFGDKGDNTILCVINHILYYLGELFIMAYLFFQLY